MDFAVALNNVGKRFWKPDVVKIVSLIEQRRNLFVGKACDSASDTGNVEGVLVPFAGKVDKIVNVRLDSFNPALHSGYGIGLSLQPNALPPYGAEFIVGDTRSSAAVHPLKIASENENVVRLQTGYIFRCIFFTHLLLVTSINGTYTNPFAKVVKKCDFLTTFATKLPQNIIASMETDSMRLASKPRFEILDGLRGVAALIVVAFHLFETYSSGPCDQILNHGYLAVDFFFVLSGFVIGYAYDDRWGRMTTWDFFKRRLIRLQPMLILGTLIGAFWFYFGDAPAFQLVAQTPWWKLLLIILLGCLMFPTPPALDIRGWQEINSLNGAAWSLMWEYVANIFYALFIRRFGIKLLAVFVFLSAFLTVDLCMNIDMFSMLEVRDYAKYTVIGGFGLSPEQIYIGIARLLYPFFMGLLLYRLGDKWRINIKHGGMTWCSLAVIMVLVMPHLGGYRPNWINGMYCALVILLVFPAIVAAGAGSPLLGSKTTAICKWLGMISYPLYITHYPMIYVQMNWVAQHPDAPLGTHIWVAVSIFIAAIAVAYASVKVYDMPIRAWLSEKFLYNKKIAK